MSDEVKIAAYQFADSMPTDNPAKLGALIIQFVTSNYKSDTYKDPLADTTPITRISNISPENTCVACEG